MPRKRRTQSGADAQNIKSVPGQRYGEGVEQQQLQQAMPAPDLAQPVTAPSSGPPTFNNASPQTGPMPLDPVAIKQFLDTTKPNLLSGSQRPTEPVTSGLPFGPGGGPEMIARPTAPIKRYFEQLSADTGNPKWKMLAAKAGL